MHPVQRVLDEQGRSVTWLAIMLELSRQAVYDKFHSGKFTPREREKIARALHEPQDMLFSDKVQA